MKRFVSLAILLSGPALALGQQEAAYRDKTVAAWTAQLADEDLRARWHATYALGQIGPSAAEAVEPLGKIVADKYDHEYVRGGAAWALGRIGPGAEPAVPRLIETLESKPQPVASVRRTVPEALGNMGPAAKPAVATLLKLLDDEDRGVRVGAAAALWKIARHDRAIPALVDMLRTGTGTLPYKAAVALGDLAEKGDITDFSDTDGHHVKRGRLVRPEGGSAEISDVPFFGEATAALVDALGHPDPDVPRAAARALGQIGPTTIPALKKALSDPAEQVRRSAVEALGWIGPPAVPALVDALKNDNASARATAARELGCLGLQAQEARPALIEAVDDPDPQVRAAAGKALGHLTRNSPVGQNAHRGER